MHFYYYNKSNIFTENSKKAKGDCDKEKPLKVR